MSKIEPSVPFTDGQVAVIEGELKRPLPDSYRGFVKQYGGAFIGGSLDGEGEFSILAFDDFDKIIRNFNNLPEYISDRMLIVGRCELGGIYIINHDNSIWYRVVHSGNNVNCRIADSFEEFFDRIVISDDIE